MRSVDENAIINATVLDANFNPVPYRETVITPQLRVFFTQRIDYALNDKNTLVGRYSFSPTHMDNRGVGDFSLPFRAYDNVDTDHTVQLTETALLSARSINETRFQFLHSDTKQLGDNNVYSLSVQDAFTGDGPQNGTARNLDTRYEITNMTTFAIRAHSIKAGGRWRRTNQDSTSPNNFGGSYAFACGPGPTLDANNNLVLGPDGNPVLTQVTSIEKYRRTLLFQSFGYSPLQIRALGGGASQFSINGGNPEIGVAQMDIGLFATWDWRANQRTTVSAGILWEDQTNISNHNNVAPRVGIAYAIDGRNKKPTKTILRVGAGIFYDRVDEGLTLNARRFNGINQVSYIVCNPDFFPTIPPVEILAPFRNSLTIRELYASLRTPYLIQTSVGIERSLPRNSTIAVNYIFSRGVHLLRQRNINTPYALGARPYGDTGNLFLSESTGFSRQSRLMTNFSTRLRAGMNLFGYYSLNQARSDTDGNGPANPYDLRNEYGPSRQDIRHRIMVGGSVAAKWGVSLSPFFQINSALPFNITTGLDTNNDTLFNERPALATNPNAPGVVTTPYGNFIMTPGPNDVIIPRNYGRGEVNYSLNLRLSKTWGFGPEVARAAGRGGAEAVAVLEAAVVGAGVGAVEVEAAWAVDPQWAVVPMAQVPAQAANTHSIFRFRRATS